MMKIAKRLLALLFFSAFIWLLYSRVRNMDWEQVWASILAMEASALVHGLLFTALAYLAFASYDLLSKWHLHHRVAQSRVVAIALVAYALNLNLGALVGGWASRFRLYSRAGAHASTTTQIIGLGILTNWSGYLLMGGLVFTAFPPALPSSWQISPVALPATGALMLLVLALYLLLCIFRSGRRWTFRQFTLRTPSPKFAFLQLASSTVHWLSMATVLFYLMPGDLPFASILGVLLMASIAGAATHVPGGLGVIESVFVAVMGDQIPPATLLASLFAFRASFYLLPLMLALITYPFLEFPQSGKTAKKASQALA